MLSILATTLTLLGTAHPHVFFSSDDAGGIRHAAATTHQAVAQHILQVLGQHLNDPSPVLSDYDDPRFFGNQVAVWAFGYQLTQDARYATKARDMIFAYLGWADWGFGEGVSLGGPDLNTSHMLMGVSIAYDWIYPTLTDADRQQIAARIGTEADALAKYLPNAWYVQEYLQNHNWIDTAGLGLAALALAGEDARASTWLSLASGNLQKLTAVLNPISDGTWHEGLPYQGYALSMSLPFWTALARTGVDYTNVGFLKGFGRLWLNAQIPDSPRQVILPYGDFTGWPRQATVEILRFTAARFNDPLAEAAARRWLSTGRGTFLPELWYDVFEFLYFDPAVPAADLHAQPLDASFGDLGGAVLHSSFDAGDLQVGFKAGPFGGHSNFNRVKNGGAPGGWLAFGHDHNDDMSFWLFGSGTWLAPEAMGDDMATSTANTAAYHNALLVDGSGMLGDARASDSNYGNSWFWQRDAQPLITTTGTADYAITGGRGASLFDPALGVTRWDRLLVLARHRYALVHDDVAASTARNFDWICHFSDGANVDTASGWVQGIAKAGQSLGVRVVSPSSWTATTGSQTAPLMNLFDPDGQTAYVRVRPSAASTQTQFLTALVPVATGAWASRPRIDALSPTDSGAGAVVSPGSALEERWIFSRPSADGKSAGDLVMKGALAGVAVHSASGAPVRAALFGAGSLSDQNGARPLLASQSARAIEVDVQGTNLVVTGDGIADFHAFAPQALSVSLNGQTVATSLESGMVSWSGNVISGGDGGSGSPDGGSGSPDSGTGTGTGGIGGGFGGSSGGADGGVASIPVAATSVGLPHTGCSSGGGANFLLAFAAVVAASMASARRRRRATVRLASTTAAPHERKASR